MPIWDILPVSGVKQGLFTARPTPRLEYEVADARNNSLTPPGNVSGPTHPHLRGNERNSRSPPSHHYEASYDMRCATPRTNPPPVEGRIQVYIPPSASRTEESTTHCETKPPASLDILESLLIGLRNLALQQLFYSSSYPPTQ